MSCGMKATGRAAATVVTCAWVRFRFRLRIRIRFGLRIRTKFRDRLRYRSTYTCTYRLIRVRLRVRFRVRVCQLLAARGRWGVGSVHGARGKLLSQSGGGTRR